MEVEITYEKEDWLKFQNLLEKEIPKSIKTSWDGFLVNVFVWAVIGAATMSVFQNISKFHWPTAGYVAAIFTILLVLFIRRMNKIKNAFAPSETGSFIGTHRFIMTEHGIESEGAGYKGFHSWAVVKKIVRANGLIILFIDTANAFIFPEQKLDEPDTFFNYANEYKNVPKKS